MPTLLSVCRTHTAGSGRAGPYLVEVVPEVEAWLSVKASPWGIYLTTYSTMNVLRQHLRRYLQVLIPDETKPVLLRFMTQGIYGIFFLFCLNGKSISSLVR
ncbi:hypothetical protein DMI66_20500 [Escherichia coli]|nr:hypothetical protein [Escherichia coli]